MGEKDLGFWQSVCSKTSSEKSNKHSVQQTTAAGSGEGERAPVPHLKYSQPAIHLGFFLFKAFLLACLSVLLLSAQKVSRGYLDNLSLRLWGNLYCWSMLLGNEKEGERNDSGLLSQDPHQGKLSACFIEVIQL